MLIATTRNPKNSFSKFLGLYMSLNRHQPHQHTKVSLHLVLAPPRNAKEGGESDLSRVQIFFVGFGGWGLGLRSLEV